jgi:uncharacterized membrane protein
MSPITYVHMVVALVFLAITLIVSFFPPRSINFFYGYRTPRSMRNEDTWKEANAYSARLFQKITVLTYIVQAISLLSTDMVTSLFITMGVYLIGLPVMIFLTERHLLQKFG